MRRTVSLIPALALAGVVLAAPALALTAEDRIAAEEAQRAFMAQRQTCDDNTVTVVDVSPPQVTGFAGVPGFKPLRAYTVYSEAIGLERQVEATALTLADRMNGLSWKGRVHFVAVAAREFSVSRAAGGSKGSWSGWQSNVRLAMVSLERRHGAWRASVQESKSIEGLGRAAHMRRVSCAEVPR